MMIHHCIGPNPEHGVYRGMSESVRVASAFLDNPAIAPDEIDVHFITGCVNSRESLLPVYSSLSQFTSSSR